MPASDHRHRDVTAPGLRHVSARAVRFDVSAAIIAGVRAEEEIADCRAPAVGDPALRQMMRPIVQHVAALTV
jgi:hypothetical protein